jgi:hypothetical protein
VCVRACVRACVREREREREKRGREREREKRGRERERENWARPGGGWRRQRDRQTDRICSCVDLFLHTIGQKAHMMGERGSGPALQTFNVQVCRACGEGDKTKREQGRDSD